MCTTRFVGILCGKLFYYIEIGGKKQGDFGQNPVDKLNFFCGLLCGKKVEEWTKKVFRGRFFHKNGSSNGGNRGVVKKCTASYPHLSTMSTVLQKDDSKKILSRNVYN